MNASDIQRQRASVTAAKVKRLLDKEAKATEKNVRLPLIDRGPPLFPPQNESAVVLPLARRGGPSTSPPYAVTESFNTIPKKQTSRLTDHYAELQKVRRMEDLELEAREAQYRAERASEKMMRTAEREYNQAEWRGTLLKRKQELIQERLNDCDDYASAKSFYAEAQERQKQEIIQKRHQHRLDLCSEMERKKAENRQKLNFDRASEFLVRQTHDLLMLYEQKKAKLWENTRSAAVASLKRIDLQTQSSIVGEQKKRHQLEGKIDLRLSQFSIEDGTRQEQFMKTRNLKHGQLIKQEADHSKTISEASRRRKYQECTGLLWDTSSPTMSFREHLNATYYLGSSASSVAA